MNNTNEDFVENTPEFLAWSQMVGCCRNPKHPDYGSFGGRGIKVCDEWLASFNTFLQQMGRMPSHNCALSRINNNGAFNRYNCIWIYPPAYVEFLRKVVLDQGRIIIEEPQIDSTSASTAPAPMIAWTQQRANSQDGLVVPPQPKSKIKCPKCTIL